MPVVPFTGGQYSEPDTTGPGSRPDIPPGSDHPPEEYWPSNGIQTDKSMMTKAPDTTYLLMAAAQMHKEKRLVKPQPKPQGVEGGLSPAMPGIGEGETEHRYHDYGEDMNREDIAPGIMRKLQINKLMNQRGYDI